MGAAPVTGAGGAQPRVPPSGTRETATPGLPALVPARPLATSLALAALAIAVRFVAWWRCEAIMNDGPTFLRLAWRFANGPFDQALAHDYHPLYPLAIALVEPLFGDPGRAWEVGSWEAAGIAVSIASGGVAALFLYDLLRHSFGGWVPAVGTLLFAVHPYAVPFSADVQSEGLYIALFLGAMSFAWRCLETPRFGLAAASGVLSGLAYLTRPEGLGVALVALGVMALLTLRRLRTLGAFGRVAAGVALGAALMVAPYVLTLERTEGELGLTRKKSLLAIATLGMDAVERSERAPVVAPGPAPREPAWKTWGHRAANSASEVADAARHAFRLDHWIIAALGAWAVGTPPGLRALFLGATVGLYGAVLLGLHLTSGYVSMRHALPPLLPLLGYVALGIPVVGRVVLALPRFALRRGPTTPRVALATGLVIAVAASATMATRAQRENRAAVRSAAEWLRAQGVADVVAAARQRDAYYAGGRFAHLPRGRDEGVGPRRAEGVRPDWVARLRKRGVRYVVLDDGAALDYPGLGEEGRMAEDARLRVLHRAEAHGSWAVVLEISGAAPLQ